MESALKKDSTRPEACYDKTFSASNPNTSSGNPEVLSRKGTQPSTLCGETWLTHWIFRLTHWETWDWRIKYLLISPAWVWFCLRARSMWFFTSSNPTLTFGGFDGESKMEMYAQLPPDKIPRSIFIPRHSDLSAVLAKVAAHQLSFPLCVKPDAGKMGLMFRYIKNPDELQYYHNAIPCDYIIQEYINLPLELSVFYMRFPGEEKGTITGFVRKDPLRVIGDGRSTLRQLLRNTPSARLRLREMESKHRMKLGVVIPEGEVFDLSPALNLSRGGQLVSLEHEKDEQLLKIFDDMSHYTCGFYYGRYDLKCTSIEALKKGDFVILEFNGSGAEPHHVYGNGNNLLKTCRILILHWAMLFRISQMNRRNGTEYWDFTKGWRFIRKAGKHVDILRKADARTPLC